MLNHSRRAPPPAPLIRLFNPNGDERQTQVDKSSADSTPLTSASDAASGSDSTGDFEEYTIGADDDSSTETSDNSTKYIELHMKWLKSTTLNKHDSLPTSVSSYSDFMIPSPKSPLSFSLRGEQKEERQSLRCLQEQEQVDKDESRPIVDWLAQLADTSFKSNDEVLLFFQSDQEPGRKVRFDC